VTDPELVEKKLAEIETYVGHLQDMAGFRNVLVHGYAELDLDVVEEILDERLDDLLALTSRIRQELRVR